MNISIIVHGVFNDGGHEFWPASTDARIVLSRFYSGHRASRHSSLIVERKPVNDKPAILYTYLRMGQFQDRQGQKSANSYFAITAILYDNYYKDVVNIYNVLDEAFRKYITPQAIAVIKPTDRQPVFSYKIKSFNEISETLVKMEAALKDYIKKFSDNSDLCQTSQTGTAPTSDTKEEINIIDFTEEEGLSLLRKGKTFSVSPLYDTRQTKEKTEKLEKEIQKIRQDCESLRLNLNQEKSQRQNLEADKSRMQLELDKRNDTINSLRKSSSSTQNELNKCKNDLKLHQDAVDEFLRKLPNIDRQTVPSTPDSAHRKPITPPVPPENTLKKALKWSIAIVCMVAIGLLMWWFLKPDPESEHINEPTSTEIPEYHTDTSLTDMKGDTNNVDNQENATSYHEENLSDPQQKAEDNGSKKD